MDVGTPRDFLKSRALDPTSRLSPPLILGFGFHWLWFYLMVHRAGQVLPFLGNDGDPLLALAWTSFCVSAFAFFIVTVGCIGAFCEKVSPHIKRRRNQVTAACCVTVGTACLLFGGNSPTLALLVSIIAGFLSGMGSGTLLLIWGEACRRRKTYSTVLNVTLALIFALFAHVVLIAFVAEPLYSILLCLLPLAQVVLLLSTLHGGPSLIKPQRLEVDEQGNKDVALGLYETFTYHRLQVDKSAFAKKIGVFSFVLGIIVGSMRFSLFMSPAAVSVTELIARIAVAGLTAVLLMSLLLVIRNGKSSLFSRATLPFVAVLLLVASPFDGETSFSTSQAFLASYICLEVTLWVSSAEISHRYRLSPLLVFGFSRAFTATGILICLLAIWASLSLGNEVWLELSQRLLPALSIAGVPVGYVFMLKEHAIMAMILPETQTVIRGEDPDCRDQKEGRQRRFVCQCKRVADAYLLSNREAEVLYYLAKGRNAAFIQKTLYISEGTAHTHIRHIYKKLDVHNHQELIDRVDTYGR